MERVSLRSDSRKFEWGLLVLVRVDLRFSCRLNICRRFSMLTFGSHVRCSCPRNPVLCMCDYFLWINERKWGFWLHLRKFCHGYMLGRNMDFGARETHFLGFKMRCQALSCCRDCWCAIAITSTTSHCCRHGVYINVVAVEIKQSHYGTTSSHRATGDLWILSQPVKSWTNVIVAAGIYGNVNIYAWIIVEYNVRWRHWYRE